MNSPLGLISRVSSFWQRATVAVGLFVSSSFAFAVDATVSPGSISSTSAGAVTVQITGLTAGSAVRVERFLDANGNGAVDAGEYLAEAYTVTDGQVAKVGGVRNINIPGDEDLTANGEISVVLRPRYGSELGRVTGNYLVRISSPTTAFPSFVRSFSISSPSYGQTVSGTVTFNGSPVPYAGVILLAQQGEDVEFVGGVVANSSGQYTFSAPAGDYMVLPIKNGYVSSFGNAASVSLGSGQNITGTNLQLAAATTSISGRATNASNGNGLPGVQLFIQSDGGSVVLTSTAFDGTYSVPVNADNWSVQVSDASLARLGFLRPQNDTLATASTLSGAAANVNFTFTKGTGLLVGTITDSNANPLAGIFLGANNNGTFSSDGVTLENGQFAVVVNAGQWNLWFDDNNPVLANYVPPQVNSFTFVDGEAKSVNLSLVAVNAHLQGTVVRNSAAVANARVGAYSQTSNSYVQTTTGADGSFNLGVSSGTWVLQLESTSAAELGVVSPSFTYNLSNNQTVGNISLNLLNATAQISGAVRDTNNQLVSGGNVYVSATLGGILYAANANIVNGNYSLPVANGAWSLYVNANGFPGVGPIGITVSGANVTRNVTVSNLPIINNQPTGQTVTEGENFGFFVSASSNLAQTYQWQVSTNSGGNWTNLSNDSTYSNVTTQNLTGVASLSLNGYLYRCIVTNSAGSATSGSAVLTVNAAAVAPTILAHPTDRSVSVGNSAIFFIQMMGTPTPSVQWQISTTGGRTWSNLATGGVYVGTTTPSLFISSTNRAMNGYYFRAVVTNSAGSATSIGAQLIVQETFNSWQQTRFTPQQIQTPEISGWSASPANDGMSNLFKYAFDLDPFIPGGGKPLPSAYEDSNQIRLGFEALRSELEYTVEASSDLVNWTVDGVTLISEGTYRQASCSLSGRAKVFLRITVRQLPAGMESSSGPAK